MSLGYGGEEPGKDRSEQARQSIDDAAAFAYLHHAEPEREHTGQAEGDFKRCAGSVERGVDDSRKDIDVAHKHQSDKCYDKGCDEEYNPDVVKHHKLISFFCVCKVNHKKAGAFTGSVYLWSAAKESDSAY